MVSGHNEDGFTLLEMLIAMAVTSIAMVALVGALTAQQRISTRQNEVAELQQNIRAATFMLENDIRMAGFKGVDNTCSTAGITQANANDLTFTYCADADGTDNDNADGDGDSSTGADEVGEIATMSYDIYDGNGTGDMDLGRQVGGLKRVVAERIDSLVFTYLDEADAVTATLDDIRTIRVALTAKAVLSARSGNTDTGLQRAVTMDINCRNLGL
jgi:type IV pilus assembly protein PilW